MPARSVEDDVLRALDALSDRGLLLLHDAKRPSLTTLVAGTPVRGSWWGHPAGRHIFQVASALDDHPDVAFIPLVDGKVTLVHRSLWPALLSVGESRSSWQMEGLSAVERALLLEVDRQGQLRASGKASKALASALLVHSHQVHTQRGAHATELQTWHSFREARQIQQATDEAKGRAALELAAEPLGGRKTLPWSRHAG